VKEAFQIIFSGQLDDEQACFSAKREHGGGVSGGGRGGRWVCEGAGGSDCFFGDDGAGECAAIGLLLASGEGVC
jgi:hypothetical protein